MKARLLSWWRQRSPREQRLLLVMAALLLIALSWLLVIRPLSITLSDAKERHGAAAVALAEARSRAEAIRTAQGRRPAALVGPVDALLSRAATEAGFPVTRLDRLSPSQATLVMDSVRPEAFFPWLGRMEGSGLAVDRLTATPNGDRTLSVQITFRARSR